MLAHLPQRPFQMLVFFFVLALFLSMPAHAAETVLGSGVAESDAVVYELDSNGGGAIVINKRFKNTLSNLTALAYNFDMLFVTEDILDIEISDTPPGSLSYNFAQREGFTVVSLGFSRVFGPGDEYTVSLIVRNEKLVEKVDGTWRFRSVQSNADDWPISPFELKLMLPRDMLYRYDLSKVEPGSEIREETGRTSVSWKGELSPGKGLSVSAEFTSQPNWSGLIVLAFLFTFIILLYYHMASVAHGISGEFLMGVPDEVSMVEKLEEVLHSAEKEVLIVSPWIFYVDWLTALLKPLVDRGVSVRMVTWPSYSREEGGDDGKVRENRKQLFALKRFLKMFPEDTVRLNDNAHSKLVVVDGARVVVSSANFTQTGLWMNYESGVLLSSEGIGRDAKVFFEKLWNSDSTLKLSDETIRPSDAKRLINDMKAKE